MKLGDFRFLTTSRPLAACLATLGVPLKANIPIINEYSERRPVPTVPFGHPRWYHGKLTWFFEACSQSWRSFDKEISPKALTAAFHDGKAAAGIQDRFVAIESAFSAGDINAAHIAYLALKNDMPFILAGFIKTALDWHLALVMPMLKEAYEQKKKTGLSPDFVTVTEGDGEIHTSTNPSDAVKESFL